MKEERQATMDEVFGPVIFAYTRKEAIADGVLVDVTATANEAGIKLPTALTRAVFEDYIRVPESLQGFQDEAGRIWDVLSMLAEAIRTKQIRGDRGTFKVSVAMPTSPPRMGASTNRLVRLRAVCGPADDGTACITVMELTED